ncbi:hypothetical protein V6Z12_D03G059800 [Gossypium hirsutum]
MSILVSILFSFKKIKSSVGPISVFILRTTDVAS